MPSDLARLRPLQLTLLGDDHRYFHHDHRPDALDNYDLVLLRSFPNVIITPHIAFYSDTVTAEMVDCAMDPLRDFYPDGRAYYRDPIHGCIENRYAEPVRN